MKTATYTILTEAGYVAHYDSGVSIVHLVKKAKDALRMTAAEVSKACAILEANSVAVLDIKAKK